MFTADDITMTAPLPRSDVQRFDVGRDGSPLGWVLIPTADMYKRLDDPASHIAERLNAYENDHGSDELSARLAKGLKLT
ncbi:hypothetical protein BH20ACT16_BH20ACT16_16090 [soil metagenome]